MRGYSSPRASAPRSSAERTPGGICQPGGAQPGDQGSAVQEEGYLGSMAHRVWVCTADSARTPAAPIRHAFEERSQVACQRRIPARGAACTARKASGNAGADLRRPGAAQAGCPAGDRLRVQGQDRRRFRLPVGAEVPMPIVTLPACARAARRRALGLERRERRRSDHGLDVGLQRAPGGRRAAPPSAHRAVAGGLAIEGRVPLRRWMTWGTTHPRVGDPASRSAVRSGRARASRVTQSPSSSTESVRASAR